MTFESQGLYIIAIYIWLPPASYVVFLTTLVIGAVVVALPLPSVGVRDFVIRLSPISSVFSYSKTGPLAVRCLYFSVKMHFARHATLL